MNMRTTPTYTPDIAQSLEARNEEIRITEALKILNDVKTGAINSRLLTELKGTETRLLQMEEDGIEYVTGAILFMLNNLKNAGSIPLTGITQVFTAANEDRYSYQIAQ